MIDISDSVRAAFIDIDCEVEHVWGNDYISKAVVKQADPMLVEIRNTHHISLLTSFLFHSIAYYFQSTGLFKVLSSG